MVLARRLNRKITIETVTETKDSYGQPSETWSTYIVRDAEVNPTGGNEYFTGHQRYTEDSTVFRLRYDSKVKAITTKMRVIYDSRTFDITSPPINIRNRNRDVDLICKEHNA